MEDNETYKYRGSVVHLGFDRMTILWCESSLALLLQSNLFDKGF